MALLVAPVRPVLECTMPVAVAEGATDEHAGHAMPESVPADDSAPTHEICPDLAHCVAVAPLATGASVEVGSAPRVVLETPVATRPASATSSLEPPPK